MEIGVTYSGGGLAGLDGCRRKSLICRILSSGNWTVWQQGLLKGGVSGAGARCENFGFYLRVDGEPSGLRRR